MWELGSEVTEGLYAERGGLNATLEQALMIDLSSWFERKCGRLLFADPLFSASEGYRLTAAEDIVKDDAILTLPVALCMCRISARNVVIRGKSSYLGEELKKTFERNEVCKLLGVGHCIV